MGIPNLREKELLTGVTRGNLIEGMYHFLLIHCPIQSLHRQVVAFRCRLPNQKESSPDDNAMRVN